MTLIIALIAFVIEWFAGYPQKLVTKIGHPVMWIGALIARLEAQYNRPDLSFAERKRNGIVAHALMLAIVLAISLGIAFVLRSIPFGWLIEALLASSLLAHKGLKDAVLAVAIPLRSGDVAGACLALSHIVGRDTAQLETSDIAKGAIETLAENASDGGIAPLIYLALFGLPGAALYKAINTADSMIGHRSERYEAYGWAAAKLDDVANFPAAPLTAWLMIIAATDGKQFDAKAARAAVRRDAKKHASPNAGWPESAMAGALGIALGGPRAYHGEVVDLPRMGDGRRELTAEDIDRAILLYKRMLLVALTLLGMAAAFWFMLIGF